MAITCKVLLHVILFSPLESLINLIRLNEHAISAGSTFIYCAHNLRWCNSPTLPLTLFYRQNM